MTTDPVISAIPQWTFGDKVRKIRRSAGMSQVEFAQRIGVKGVTVGSWETNPSEPRGLVALSKRIEMAFGAPGLAEWLLGMDEPMPTPPPSTPPSGPRRDDAALAALIAEKTRGSATPGYSSSEREFMPAA